MTGLKKAAQQALDALEWSRVRDMDAVERNDLIAALEAALEQPEQDTDCHAQGICQRSGYGIEQPEQPVQEPVTDRAAFERHAESLGYSVDPDTRAGREGGYWSSHTQLMWKTWQAALEQPEQAVPYAVWRQGFDAVRKYKEDNHE